MNKNNMKTAALILALVILAVNTVMLVQMKKELKVQSEKYFSLESYLRGSVEDLRSGIQVQYGDIQELLLADQSIFSQTTVDLKPQNGQIAVTMRAVPKELAAGETMFARVTADGRQQEQRMDENGQAVILVDMAKTITPEFVIRSDAGVRQEALNEIHTNDILSSRIVGQWDWDNAVDGKKPLNLWIEAYGDRGLPFTADQVEKAEFIVVNSGRKEGTQNGGSGSEPVEAMAVSVDGLTLDAFQNMDGDRIAAKPVSDSGGHGIGFWADFSEYAARKDGIRYDIFFWLTTKDGMHYGAPDAAASFSSMPQSQSNSDGDGVLMPVFQ